MNTVSGFPLHTSERCLMGDSAFKETLGRWHVERYWAPALLRGFFPPTCTLSLPALLILFYPIVYSAEALKENYNANMFTTYLPWQPPQRRLQLRRHDSRSNSVEAVPSGRSRPPLFQRTFPTSAFARPSLFAPMPCTR
jgi:hypothetical protein